MEFLNLPLVVWGGMAVFGLIIIQTLSGLRVLKIKPVWHTRILWKLILLLGAVHFIYGVSMFL